MEDCKIVELYWQRDQAAISETKRKYGWYCTSIAYQILSSFEDSEECVSDAYLRTWNAIPPARPASLKCYLGRVTRNLALDRVKARSAQKRGELPLVLEELEIASLDTPEDQLQRKELSAAITAFLRTQPPVKQRAFVLRYWYFEPLPVIGKKLGWKPERVKTELYRMRKKLSSYLTKEGFQL